MLSPVVARELERVLSVRFGEVGVSDARPVGGGCISTTLRVRLSGGPVVFVKLAPERPPGNALLEAEAEALARLRATGEVRVPEVLAQGNGWLALEWLEPGAGAPGAWERLGRGLAGLHRRGGEGAVSYGWARDNFIGSLPQRNAPEAGWGAFWRSHRLEPQLALAQESGLLSAQETAAFEPLLRQLPELLSDADAEGPALLHGDLWSGNVHMTSDGEAAIIDPAAYYGHREVDLAMAALFGGFPGEFYRAYDAAWPLRRAGMERRRATYQLYYLLVHVNLFGRGYLGGTRDALRRALGG